MTQIRATLIRMLWEKQFAKSPWHDKFHLMNKASLEADYGMFADEILSAVNERGCGLSPAAPSQPFKSPIETYDMRQPSKLYDPALSVIVLRGSFAERIKGALWLLKGGDT